MKRTLPVVYGALPSPLPLVGSFEGGGGRIAVSPTAQIVSQNRGENPDIVLH